VYLPKSVFNYIKNKEKNKSDDIIVIRDALRRSGHKNYVVFFTDDKKFVLLNTDKDISSGVIIENNNVVDFKNTDDYQAVTVDAYARCSILNSISDSVDLERVKALFTDKKTWIIHCVRDTKNGSFEAHTHGMNNYSHRDFRIRDDIGEESISYLFNALCKNVQKGVVFKDKNKIENLYENYDVILRSSNDGFFDVVLEETAEEIGVEVVAEA
jgi:hypothetical protein